MKFLLIPIVAILLIAGLELVAILKGINGSALSLAFAAIGSIATGGTIKYWHKFKGFHISVNKGENGD